MYDKNVSLSVDICSVTKAELKQKIGERIVELRTEKGWSQSDLARACAKDRQAMEKLENGKVNPTLYTLQEVASALKVSLSELINF
ncbi:MAG: helix-turn-helix transcriptional regulator [Bacteroidota bacterium]